jgi:hypothetical protein
MEEYFSKFINKGLPGGPNQLKSFTEGFIVSSQGQWEYPGMNTLIPNAGGRITMQGVNQPVLGIDDLGNEMLMEPGEEYQFPGDSVYEIPMKKGGLVKMPKLTKSNKKSYSKKFSRSLEATNRLFTENDLFKKPKSKKRKVFDPKSQYQEGGITDQEKIDAANTGMMKARLAYAHMHGNPAAQRMVVAPDEPYDFGNGMTGTHYMASMDNYAVPQIQDINDQLMLGDYSPESAEAIRFDNPEDAEYFAEHYKEVSPAFEAELSDEEIEEYKKGGWVVEELDEYANGGGGMTMAAYEQQLRQLENSIKAGYKGGRWYPHDSPEGGTKTIGYGHKMSGKENYSKGLTTAQVLAMQKKDLAKHANIAKSMVDQKYGAGTFDRLPESRKVLLVDYAYNGVLHEFPNFMKATVKGDKAGMLKEYKRYTGSKPLTQRNEWTRSVIEGTVTTPKATNTPKTLPAKTVAKQTAVKKPVVKEPTTKPTFSSKETFSYDNRPGAVYKVADSGDWYINLGKQTQNNFVPMNDPTGERMETLRKFAHVNEEPLADVLHRINNSSNYDIRQDLGYMPGQ